MACGKLTLAQHSTRPPRACEITGLTRLLDTSVWAPDYGAGEAPIYEPGVPAVRVEHNVVRVPVSYALEIWGLGPFSIVNNHLSCGGMVPVRRGGIAQTVLILNSGTAIDRTVRALSPSTLFAEAMNPDKDIADFRDVSSGAVLFTNNICQLEARAGGQIEDDSVSIVTLDHLIFYNNHCWLDASGPSALMADALLVAGSLNIIGNRFQEAPSSTPLSAVTNGKVNVTGQNIST